MKYCSVCGENVVLKIPEDDNRERFCCDSCGAIHYENPKVVVGTLPFFENKVLLCKRAIQPRLGLWTLPAGFYENGETLIQGALRETKEETNADVEAGELYGIFNIPQINQVYMIYLAKVGPNDFSVTSESSEIGLFDEEEIPWDILAFPWVNSSLKNFFADLKSGNFILRTEDIIRR